MITEPEIYIKSGSGKVLCKGLDRYEFAFPGIIWNSRPRKQADAKVYTKIVETASLH